MSKNTTNTIQSKCKTCNIKANTTQRKIKLRGGLDKPKTKKSETAGK